MSRDPDPVPQPLAVTPRPRRRLDETLGLRCRPAVVLAVRATMSLRRSSRLRQVLIRAALERGTEALNRGDYEAAYLLWRDDCESTFPAQMTALGDPAGTRGRAARVRFQAQWTKEWGGIRFDPKQVVDLGDRILGLGDVEGSGRASGAGFGNEWAFLLTIRGGEVVREQIFLSHDEARAAAGL
jgi:ketosteroid isomerase-like protein